MYANELNERSFFEHVTGLEPKLQKLI